MTFVIDDLNGISEAKWDEIIRYGMEFAAEVCKSYSNSVSNEFCREIQVLMRLSNPHLKINYHLKIIKPSYLLHNLKRKTIYLL